MLATDRGFTRAGLDYRCPIHGQPAPDAAAGGVIENATVQAIAPPPFSLEAQVATAYLANVIRRLERDGEWVLTAGDVGFLKRITTLIAQGQPKP